MCKTVHVNDFIFLFLPWIVNIYLGSAFEFATLDRDLKLERLSAGLGLVEG